MESTPNKTEITNSGAIGTF